eukprot:SAG31_NODE_7287_length_1731_cov_1.481005_1_plen_64_part_10
MGALWPRWQCVRSHVRALGWAGLSRVCSAMGGKEEGGRRKEEGGRRKEEGGRRKEEGGRRKEEG